ncbi:hypothetical protein RclHR1_36980001 [Rhizophagus clarus]|uniref:Uncharacterized protein n=1 Tax=Rhizophagus clarus TaxID=94130 RepID=A0A2Z6RBV8_9GLOM|nr:hypothetical protein RclHR1_36980001 [Rhizophagus clarus]GES86979.1 hypothetical protein GLOIN_2v1488939 [Rhizophagus clarus]
MLPEGDLDAYEYLHIEDEVFKGGLTNCKIVDAVLNANKKEEHLIDENKITPILEKVSLTEAEDAINKMMKFLYKQGLEFGEFNNELKVLRGLHKRIKLLIVNNLKQADIYNYF